MFKNQRVLITGGSGMIGRSLIKLLLEKGAIIYSADLSRPDDLPDGVTHIQTDLRYYDNCLEICAGKDYVFHLAGVKGSPKMAIEQPKDFMVPMLQFNTNMMEAAYRMNVKWYLYTSSVGVYGRAKVFYEDDVWKTFPSENDKYAGWAKRIGELQAETYKIQHNWNRISIVRPANVYGPYDNFNPLNCMVIPSLIRKANENDTLEVWGDGTPIRDFIYSDDVALGMISLVENGVTEPINLGSGTGFTIKELVDKVIKHSSRKNEIVWLKDYPNGDQIRLFDTKRSNSYNIKSIIDLDEGIKRTTEWFLNNKNNLDKRYNAFVHG
jgi:GDP-L-fucose synthase